MNDPIPDEVPVTDAFQRECDLKERLREANKELDAIYRECNGFGKREPGIALTLAQHEMKRLKQYIKNESL